MESEKNVKTKSTVKESTFMDEIYSFSNLIENGNTCVVIMCMHFSISDND